MSLRIMDENDGVNKEDAKLITTDLLIFYVDPGVQALYVLPNDAETIRDHFSKGNSGYFELKYWQKFMSDYEDELITEGIFSFKLENIKWVRIEQDPEAPKVLI